MEHVRLGRTGLQVSRICLGMMSYGSPDWREWVLPADQAEPFVRDAADAGITFFDTADVYSGGASEEATGAALRSVFARREDYVLATKVYGRMGAGPNDAGLSRGHILDAVDASLRRLGVDHIDLYQIHRWDPLTPIEETMEALHDCVRAGKVRYLGASSMYAWQFAKAQRVAALHGWTEFVAMQPHYNLLYREEEREMLPLCVDSGVGARPAGASAGSRGADDAGADRRAGPRTLRGHGDRDHRGGGGCRGGAERQPRSGRPRLVARAPRRRCPDHRRHEASPPDGSGRSDRAAPLGRGGRHARSAVPTVVDPRPRLSRIRCTRAGRPW